MDCVCLPCVCILHVYVLYTVCVCMLHACMGHPIGREYLMCARWCPLVTAEIVHCDTTSPLPTGRSNANLAVCMTHTWSSANCCASGNRCLIISMTLRVPTPVAGNTTGFVLLSSASKPISSLPATECTRCRLLPSSTCASHS